MFINLWWALHFKNIVCDLKTWEIKKLRFLCERFSNVHLRLGSQNCLTGETQYLNLLMFLKPFSIFIRGFPIFAASWPRTLFELAISKTPIFFYLFAIFFFQLNISIIKNCNICFKKKLKGVSLLREV